MIEVNSISDDMIKAHTIQDFVNRFGRVIADNADIQSQTDETRRKSLVDAGYRTGRGEVWNSNACLADSLIQTLITAQVLLSHCDAAWRRVPCIAARKLLCDHANVLLRPRQRDHLGNILSSTSKESHANDLLEHDVHACVFIDCFLQYAQVPWPADARGFWILFVHSFRRRRCEPIRKCFFMWCVF